MSGRASMTFFRILNALTLILAKRPYLRVGQVLVNASGVTDLYYMKDEDLAEALEQIVAEIKMVP